MKTLRKIGLINSTLLTATLVCIVGDMIKSNPLFITGTLILATALITKGLVYTEKNPFTYQR